MKRKSSFMERKVIIGSTNPAKVDGVRKAALTYWPNVDVIGRDAQSRVPKMPMSKNEIRFGAKSRAEYIIENYDSWLAVGNEGGAAFIEGNWYLFGTTYVTDGSSSSWGGELQIRLPNNMVEGLSNGSIELGTVIDNLTNRKDVKKQEGAIGLLTDMRLTRSEVFQMSAMQALAYWYFRSKNDA
jgi:inosine/xanthosine triphosphatase